MLWCQGAENIGLSNHKHKSALNCTVWPQCTPVSDRQTNIMTIVRRFVLTNASHTKNSIVTHSLNQAHTQLSSLDTMTASACGA